ncbi:MAG: hypothetical protein KUG77_09765 [Nannocystaceae bacterium]|nr:hypothetical protein [Nannocystaceae bacterium]
MSVVTATPDEELASADAPAPVSDVVASPDEAELLPEEPDTLSAIVAPAVPLGFEAPLAAVVRPVPDASESVVAGVFAPHPATSNRPTPHMANARIRT